MYIPPEVYVLGPMAESRSSITSCTLVEAELKYSVEYSPTRYPPEVVAEAVSFNPISPT